MTPAVKTQNAPFVLRSAISNRRHGGAAWAFVRDHWDEANDRFPSNTIVRMADGVKLLNTPSSSPMCRRSSPPIPSRRPPRRSNRSSNANGSMQHCAAARAMRSPHPSAPRPDDRQRFARIHACSAGNRRAQSAFTQNAVPSADSGAWISK